MFQIALITALYELMFACVMSDVKFKLLVRSVNREELQVDNEQMKAKRKNLGLRASPEKQSRLRQLALARGISLQAVFDEAMDKLLSEAQHVANEPPGAGQIGIRPDSEWRTLFLRALPAAAAIKSVENLTLVWVNEGYAAMAGEAASSLVGKRVGQIWAARDSAALIEAHDREVLKKNHATVQIEKVKDRWGKSMRRLRIRFPVYGNLGEIQYLGAIGFNYDEILSQIRPR